jgi:ribosome-binding factor A
MEARRTERVAEMLRVEIGEIINYELQDPRITQVAVTEVLFPAGAKQAHVRLAIEGTPEQQETCLEAIIKASGFIKIQVAERIDVFRMPDLKFYTDVDPAVRARQKNLLRKVRRGRPRDPEKSTLE